MIKVILQLSGVLVSADITLILSGWKFTNCSQGELDEHQSLFRGEDLCVFVMVTKFFVMAYALHKMQVDYITHNATWRQTTLIYNLIYYVFLM